jgi:hypothetical protein
MLTREDIIGIALILIISICVALVAFTAGHEPYDPYTDPGCLQIDYDDHTGRAYCAESAPPNYGDPRIP